MFGNGQYFVDDSVAAIRSLAVRSNLRRSSQLGVPGLLYNILGFIDSSLVTRRYRKYMFSVVVICFDLWVWVFWFRIFC